MPVAEVPMPEVETPLPIAEIADASASGEESFALPVPEEASLPELEEPQAEAPAGFSAGKFTEAIEYVEGIGPAFAQKLNEVGIFTPKDLLERGATSKGRDEIAELAGISGKLVLEWVNHCDLFRIKGVGSEYADLLEAAGVDTVVELATRNPANLYLRMVDVNAEKNLVRRVPVQSQVEEWVAQAKLLPRVITY
jgi:predicted flap endonuclease-1-like 5' DNA nuclease